MAKKPEYRKYQIKYIVRSIVYEEVVAESFEKAKKRADKTMGGNIFIDQLEVLDETQEFVGYDDLTAWDSVQN